MENRNSVDQRSARIKDFLQQRAGELARQGAIVATRRRAYDGQILGSYYLLVCRDAHGKQRSVYLGQDASVLDYVHRELAKLQAPWARDRQFARVRAQLRAALRQVRRELDAELKNVGLVRKGSEIRGWSSHARLPGNSSTTESATAQSLDHREPSN